MDNTDIAFVLQEIGELLEIEGESSFRVGAYFRASQVIRSLPQDINQLDKDGRLTEISGVGQGIADRLHELLSTGSMAYYEQLKQRVPSSLAQLIHVPGLGPKKAKLIYEQLNIETLEQLQKALADKKLRRLPGMGAKTEDNISKGLAQYQKQSARLILSQAVPTSEKIVSYLHTEPRVKSVSPAGSLRRWQETIGDIDLLCATKEPQKVADLFCAYPDVDRVLAKGPTKCSILLKSGLQTDLRLVGPEAFGAALQYFTGSKRHNIAVREIAKKRKLKLSEYGLFNARDQRKAGKTEEEIYHQLGMAWIPPELREDRGEIEAAIRGRLPNLVRVEDILGDLHAHTKSSDGKSSLEEMARYALELGYSYLCISDHAANLKVAGGLELEEFEKQWADIDRINKKIDGLTLLKGIELNIDNEGRVDFPDGILARFDIVTASIHSGFGQDKSQLTERTLAAIENPHIHVISHPTGRILGRRQPYQIDLAAVFKRAARTGTVLELNSFPDRLDLRDDYLMEAKKAGCSFAISTDAHHTGQLNYMRYGVATARRAWLEAGDIINTYAMKKLKEALT